MDQCGDSLVEGRRMLLPEVIGAHDVAIDAPLCENLSRLNEIRTESCTAYNQACVDIADITAQCGTRNRYTRTIYYPLFGTPFRDASNEPKVWTGVRYRLIKRRNGLLKVTEAVAQYNERKTVEKD